jgi:hypothetical protein
VEARLALVDLALPALRRLSRAQYEAFRATVERLVTADERLSLLELVLRRVLVRHLEPHFGRVPPAPAVYGSVAMVREPAGALLSLLAHAGTREPEAAAGAFASGAARLRGADLHLLPRENCSLALVDGALDALARTTPPLKARIVEACASVVVHDGQVKRWEAELLRAVADALECPMPPLLGASTAATATAAGGRTAIAR